MLIAKSIYRIAHGGISEATAENQRTGAGTENGGSSGNVAGSSNRRTGKSGDSKRDETEQTASRSQGTGTVTNKQIWRSAK